MKSKAYKPPNMRQIVISKPRVHAWWPADAEPIITPQTKVTIGPSPGRVLRTNTHEQ